MLEKSIDDPIMDKERSNEIQAMMADVEDDEELKEKIIMIKYATDPSYFAHSTPEEIWETFKRREAWADHFPKMITVTIAQFLMCLFPLAGETKPITDGTIVTTFLYVIVLFLFSPIDNVEGILRAIRDQLYPTAKYCGGFGMVISIFLLSPAIALAILIGLAFDFAMPRPHSASYSNWVNVAVGMMVKITAISIGLRSSSPLYSLGSFVGFDFISNFDEMVIETIEPDLTKPIKLVRGGGIISKMFRVKVMTYVSAILTYVVVVYFTLNNHCFLYCDDI